MTLESILVSSDLQAISILESVLEKLRIGVEVDAEPAHAQQRLARSKYDAVIVDCDLQGADRFLKNLPTMPTGKASVPLAIAGNATNLHELSDLGARFVFEKPIRVEQAVRTLSAARNLMLRGRLRYYRHAVDGRVTLALDKRQHFSAQLTNISQSGIGIRTTTPLEIKTPFHVRFDLPGTGSFVEARAELAWQDLTGNLGIHFLEVSERLQRRLEYWLAERYFSD